MIFAKKIKDFDKEVDTLVNPFLTSKRKKTEEKNTYRRVYTGKVLEAKFDQLEGEIKPSLNVVTQICQSIFEYGDTVLSSGYPSYSVLRFGTFTKRTILDKFIRLVKVSDEEYLTGYTPGGKLKTLKSVNKITKLRKPPKIDINKVRL